MQPSNVHELLSLSHVRHPVVVNIMLKLASTGTKSNVVVLLVGSSAVVFPSDRLFLDFNTPKPFVTEQKQRQKGNCYPLGVVFFLVKKATCFTISVTFLKCFGFFIFVTGHFENNFVFSAVSEIHQKYI